MSTPPTLVTCAAALAQSYPTLQTLILQADRTQFPVGFGDSIDGARALFEEVQFGGHGCEATRRHVLFTLRHFPLRAAAGAAWLGGDVKISAGRTAGHRARSVRCAPAARRSGR